MVSNYTHTLSPKSAGAISKRDNQTIPQAFQNTIPVCTSSDGVCLSADNHTLFLWFNKSYTI